MHVRFCCAALVRVASFVVHVARQGLGIEIESGSCPMVDPKGESLQFTQSNFPKYVKCFWKTMSEVASET